MADNATKLRLAHELRLKAHGWPADRIAASPWPQSDADWRQTPHGAPWDTNVTMAQWHLDFARRLYRAGLLDA